jgi:spore germination protein KC
MNRRFVSSVAFISAVLMLTGCWDYTEPEDVGIVTVLGINYTEQNQFEIVTEDKTLVPEGQLINQRTSWSFDIHKSAGSTITDALQKNMRQNSERPYLAHVKAIIVSEELAGSQGLRPVMDFLGRNTELRANTFFLISKKGEFEKILLPNAKYNKDTGEIVEKTIEEKRNNSFMLESRLGDIMELYWSSCCAPYALGVGAARSDADNENIDQGYDNVNVKTYEIDLGDIAVFKNDKLAGWLTGEESRGFLWVMGKVKGGYITVEYGGKRITLKIRHLKSEKKPAFKDEKMEISISIDVEADAVESLADINFNDKDAIDEVEQALERKITKEINDAINASKSMAADVFGFGESFYKSYPNYWKATSGRWPGLYPEFLLDIQVHSIVQHHGLIKKPASTVQ